MFYIYGITRLIKSCVVNQRRLTYNISLAGDSMEETKVITKETSTSSSTVDNTSTQTAQQTIVAPAQRTDQRLNQCPSDPLEKQFDQLYDPTLFKPRSKIKELLFCGSYSKNVSFFFVESW